MNVASIDSEEESNNNVIAINDDNHNNIIKPGLASNPSDVINPKDELLCLTDPCIRGALNISVNREEIVIDSFSDDTGFAVPNKKIISDFIEGLRGLGFNLDVEEYFSCYFGVKSTPISDCRLNTSLINEVLEALNMLECKPTRTPSTQIRLGINPSGEGYDQSNWVYSVIVGILLYLATRIGPDITLGVSQAARFIHTPKKTYVFAVKLIPKIYPSILQAEYIGLANALQALIPVHGFIIDILNFLEITAKSRGKGFEDNQEVLKEVVHMMECNSKKMTAHYLTEGLMVSLFGNNRYHLYGW